MSAAGGAEHPLLYGYWRSSSSYRVRIALNLKGVPYEPRIVNLVREGGEHQRSEYRELNPLGLVPALVHRGHRMVQSVAICEYLEETWPEPPLLPRDPVERARVRSMVQTIACEIQPLNNLGVMKYLAGELGQADEAVREWYAHWVARGFAALETWLGESLSGDFCHGNSPTLADCYLVPQVYNAERFECDLSPYPRIEQITARCRSLEAFRRAAPEQQPDAVAAQ